VVAVWLALVALMAAPPLAPPERRRAAPAVRRLGMLRALFADRI
jgi:hypothetical protein